MDVAIRPAETPADYRACRDAQRRAWGIVEDSYLVPIATMVGAQLHGGLVLGAFLPGGEAVGMSFAFLGRTGGRPCLYSQLTGVVPGFQGMGLGSRLKHSQRDFARETDVPLLAWAFDPMRAGNARFNLARLGASAGVYHPDMYGPRTDALNAGTATDRLIAEWESDPAKAAPATEAGRIGRLIAVAETSGGPHAPMIHEPAGGGLALLEIPADVGALGVELAAVWRQAVRVAFLDAFAEGYRARGFVDHADMPGGPRCFYVLRRGR